jgi:threonine/homoserine/homoserine lactone efflux protein
MTVAWFISLLGFAVVTSITPGPNNLMLTASGAHFGLRRSVPHIAGITLGFPLMVVLTGFGLHAILTQAGPIQGIIQWVGIGYMLWLAWKVATAGEPNLSPQGGARPLTALEAALFQWVNPKGWTMVAAMAATYFHEVSDFSVRVFVAGALFLVIGLASSLIWTAFGVGVGRLLSTPGRARAFNIGMAALLVASLAPLIVAGINPA